MSWRVMNVFAGCLTAVLLSTQLAWSVSFGRIDVASHMGEPFYAEVLLHLSERESLAKTSVGLGSVEDYSILEVYRDDMIDYIRADIVDDQRGVRVTLNSESVVDAAFFNLVLKIRYGRSTHYKKIPVFLEPLVIKQLASNPKPAKKTEPVETFNVVERKLAHPVVSQAVGDDGLKDRFTPYEGWARTSRYGPMMFGDTVATVAYRLRLDQRFTNQQVMVALFEKNRNVFAKDNINLIKAGEYLDVPTADEVAKVSLAQVKKVLSQQNRVWKDISKQAEYAEVVAAQKTRYTRQIHIGAHASGVESLNVNAADTAGEKKNANQVGKRQGLTGSRGSADQGLGRGDGGFSLLQQKIEAMEKRMADMEAADTGFHAEPPTLSVIDDAVLSAQNKRLEIIVVRLKEQLEQSRLDALAQQEPADWLVYTLAGLALMVLSLLLAIVLLLRRQPQHSMKPHSYMQPGGMLPSTIEDNLEAVQQLDTAAQEAASSPVIGKDTSAVRIEIVADKKPRNDVTAEVGTQVDLLQKADDFLLAGNFESAEAQVRLLLAKEQNNAEAHMKCIQIQRARKDDVSEAEALLAARVMLTGSALVTFESMLDAEHQDDLEHEIFSEHPETDVDAALDVQETAGLAEHDGLEFDVVDDKVLLSESQTDAESESAAVAELSTDAAFEIAVEDLPFEALNLDEIDMSFAVEEEDDAQASRVEQKTFPVSTVVTDEQREALVLEDALVFESDEKAVVKPDLGLKKGSELEGLMNDLDGLLDESAPNK